MNAIPDPTRRAVDRVCLGLFGYLAAVVTGLVAVARAPWSPAPWMLGAALSVLVGFGAYTFPHLAVRAARRRPGHARH